MPTRRRWKNCPTSNRRLLTFARSKNVCPHPGAGETNRPGRGSFCSPRSNPDRPIRIVVESISARRRGELADVEADEAEVEELGDEEEVA
jgi:hypothetical protein